MMRRADEVFEDHLRLRSLGDLESDLERNYADDVVVLCEQGSSEGPRRHSKVRSPARSPAAECRIPVPEGEHAFLVWKAQSERFEVEDGADSFVIRGGRIVVQTIFYRLSKRSLDDEQRDQQRA